MILSVCGGGGGTVVSKMALLASFVTAQGSAPTLTFNSISSIEIVSVKISRIPVWFESSFPDFDPVNSWGDYMKLEELQPHFPCPVGLHSPTSLHLL